MEIPVYLFTGFLEAGKTKYIQETLEDPEFCSGEPTLLLVCEEGVEEYHPERFAAGGVAIRVIDELEDLTEEKVTALVAETGASRLIVEYNGMWPLNALDEAMPVEWPIYQEFMFADASAAAEVDQVGQLMDHLFARAMTEEEPTEEQLAIARVISDVWLSNLVAWLTRRSSATDVANRLELTVELLLGDGTRKPE